MHGYNRKKEIKNSRGLGIFENRSAANLIIFLLTLLHGYINILYVDRQRYHSLGYESEIGLQATKSSKEAFNYGNQEKSSQEKEEKVADLRSQVSVNFQGK